MRIFQTRFMPVQSMIIALGLLASGCVTGSDVEVKTSPTVTEDRDYLPVYERFTKHAKVIINLEKRYEVTATLLSPEMRGALATRYERIFKVPQPVLDDASNKTGFFVSLFSPDSRGFDLEDEVLWTVLLESEGGKRKPTLVKRIDEKERWQTFFPSILKWTKEYLVIFDQAVPEVADPSLVKQEQVKLIFANADATVSLGW
jgi:hypothetical protein